jgi:hypothetical protein
VKNVTGLRRRVPQTLLVMAAAAGPTAFTTAANDLTALKNDLQQATVAAAAAGAGGAAAAAAAKAAALQALIAKIKEFRDTPVVKKIANETVGNIQAAIKDLGGKSELNLYVPTYKSLLFGGGGRRGRGRRSGGSRSRRSGRK